MESEREPIDRERELVARLKVALETFDRTEAAHKKAKEELDSIKDAVCAMLEEQGKDRTASYTGVGFASSVKPRLYASCNAENQETLHNILRQEGRGDMVKETVHHSSLAAWVGERLEAGKPVPQIVAYGFKNNVRLYPPKGE